MNIPTAHIATRRALSRRNFLRGAGCALSLPFLEAMRPAFRAVAAQAEADATPRRMFGICNNLGLLPENFFPEQGGDECGAVSADALPLAPARCE